MLYNDKRLISTPCIHSHELTISSFNVFRSYASQTKGGAIAVAIVTVQVSGERKGNLIKFEAKTHLYYLLKYYKRFHSESQHDPALPNQRQAEKLVGCTVFKF